jgi:hypothetical protein
MADSDSTDEMLSEVREYEALNLLIKDELLKLQTRKVELKDRFEASRKRWQSAEHAIPKQEEVKTVILSVGSVLAELREMEAQCVAPRKRLMDSLEKIPKRKVSKWRPVLAELNAENETYFREAIPSLVQMVDKYESAIGALERYVNTDT